MSLKDKFPVLKRIGTWYYRKTSGMKESWSKKSNNTKAAIATLGFFVALTLFLFMLFSMPHVIVPILALLFILAVFSGIVYVVFCVIRGMFFKKKTDYRYYR